MKVLRNLAETQTGVEPMRTLVVYESMYGNTHLIADAIMPDRTGVR